MGKRKFYGERKFSTMSINMVEALTLNVTELMKISNEFPRTCEFIYREQSELLGEIVRARLQYIDKMKNQERLEMRECNSPNEFPHRKIITSIPQTPMFPVNQQAKILANQ